MITKDHEYTFSRFPTARRTSDASDNGAVGITGDGVAACRVFSARCFIIIKGMQLKERMTEGG